MNIMISQLKINKAMDKKNTRIRDWRHESILFVCDMRGFVQNETSQYASFQPRLTSAFVFGE